MLPTIVGLNSIRLARSTANDFGGPVLARDERGRFVSLAQAAANDTVDIFQKTLDRIMARHNGHDRPIPRAANELTAFEKTMDRIMQRHNGHDIDMPEASNDMRFRIFHDPAGPLAQEDRNKDNRDWEPYVIPPEKKMRTLTLRNRLEDLDDDEVDDLEKGKAKRTNILLRKIEKNTEKSTKLLQQIEKQLINDDDGMGVHSLRAKEMAQEDWQGNYPSGSKSNSGMAPEGNQNGTSSWDKKLEALNSLKGNVIGALAFLGIGGFAKLIGKILGTNPDSPGGGYKPGRTPDQKIRGDAPKPSPSVPGPIATRPSVIPSNQVQGRNSKGRKDELQIMAFSSFKKLGYTDEAAKTLVSEIGRENGFNEDETGKLGDIFGYHVDPYNKVTNVGMFSWQGSRAKNLEKILKEKKLLVNGKIKRSQESMDVMAEFLDEEMKLDDKMKDARAALFDSNKTYDDIQDIIGRKVIKWRIDDPRYRDKGLKNQDHFFNSISSLVKGRNKPTEKVIGAEWKLDPKEVTKQALKDLKSNQGKAQKMVNGSIVVNEGSKSVIIMNPPKSPPSNQKTPEKKRVPPSRQDSWFDTVKHYFDF
jgi:hypothetical protein